MAREKRDIRPVLLKFGVALALSLGGILYSVLRTKRVKPSQSLPPLPPPPPPPPTPASPSDCGNQVDSGKEKTMLNHDNHAGQTPSSSSNSASTSITPEQHEELCLHKVSPNSSVAGVEKPHSHVETPGALKCAEREDHEQEIKNLKKLVMELQNRFPDSSVAGVEKSHSDVETPEALKCAEREDHEQEIKNLKKLVMELQNRLKINNTEAKLRSLKIESLQADNRRLEGQVADYAKVVAELESARTKIKLLNKKLKAETDQYREQILTIKQRVKRLQDQECEAVASDLDMQLNLQRVKDLEEEAEKLRRSNHSLQLENSDLAQRLENTQMLATSFLEDQEAEALKAESQRLRQQNEDLLKIIEQLQADRCADVEEVVYLRWINACLRYELRNYQPGPGKTIARDLSRTLSPKSEEKAKQLIIEYANKEGFAEKGITITDYDFDLLSSSHSYLSDSGDFGDSSADCSSANKTDTSSKTRVLRKLRNLIWGRDDHHHHSWGTSSVERSAIEEDLVGKSCGSAGRKLGVLLGVDAGTDEHNNGLRSSSRYSLDIERLRGLKEEDVKDLGGNHRNHDVGSPCVYKTIVSGRGSVSDSVQESQLLENPGTVRKSEVVKYAEILKDSSRERSKFHRRAVSHGSVIHF